METHTQIKQIGDGIKMKEDLIKFCEESDVAPIAEFCKRREELHNRFFPGLVFSTSHGISIFKNVLDCLRGREWKEEGEYGNNFRKGIDKYRKMS